MKHTVIIIFLSLIAWLPLSANATLITETWQFTLPSNNTIPGLNAGGTYSVTATYDEASLIMHEYNDGSDGEADFGAPDDTIYRTLCTGAASGGAGCNFSYFATYSLFADAMITATWLDDISIPGRNAYSTNSSWRVDTTSGMRFLNYKADSVFFELRYGSGIQADYARIYYHPSSGLFSAQGATDLIIRTSAVPEPSILLLMATGLAGLGYQRRRCLTA